MNVRLKSVPHLKSAIFKIHRRDGENTPFAPIPYAAYIYGQLTRIENVRDDDSGLYRAGKFSNQTVNTYDKNE